MSKQIYMVISIFSRLRVESTHLFSYPYMLKSPRKLMSTVSNLCAFPMGTKQSQNFSLLIIHKCIYLSFVFSFLVPRKSEVIFSQAWSSIFIRNNLRSTQLWFLNLSLPIAHEKLDFTIHSVMCWYSSYSTFKNLIGLACNN